MKEEKEKLRKEIEDLIDQIATERSFNENKGTISFLQYQLWYAQKKLKEMDELPIEKDDDNE